MQRAADLVWCSALGHDASLPLKNLSQRLADVLGVVRSNPWLTVCLDGLMDVRTAQDLLVMPLAEWGVRLVVACDPATAEVFEQQARKHPAMVETVRLGGFSVGDRDRYLQGRLGDAWVHVPDDVRELLRRPQLADMYCDLAEENGKIAASGLAQWRPRNEYELLARYWNRLATDENAARPRDMLRVHRLAGTILESVAYPWDLEQLEVADIDDDAIGRLTRRGWLRREDADHYAMPHNRLLNFAVAKELTARCRSRKVDAGGIADLFADLLPRNGHIRSIELGYVLMDWFYLALQNTATGETAREVLALLQDRLEYSERMAVDRDLLPTLEAAAVPLLMERLEALAEDGLWWALDAVLDGLATRPVAELRDRVLALLSEGRPQVQRAAVKLLARKPMAEALDMTWDLHKRMQADPAIYCGKKEPSTDSARHSVYKDSFAALRACVRLLPSWITTVVRRADPASEPVHDLAYLIGNLDDGGDTWRACKHELFRKLEAGKRRALAMNIGIWRDTTEMDRLEEWAHMGEDHLGPAAVQALARIDPVRAAGALRRLPEHLLYWCRHWYLPHLFLTAGDVTRAALYDRIQASDDPLRAARVYQGIEHEMDARTLGMLLDALERAIAHVLEVFEAKRAGGGDGIKNEPVALYSSFSLLASVGQADLLEAFAARAGSPLESRIVRLLTDVIGPRRSLGHDDQTRKPAITVLLRIGGDGHRQVINAFLDADSQYGKLDAIRAASTDADTQTLVKLRSISVSKELWDGRMPLLQQEAAYALAAHGDTTGLGAAVLHLGLKTPWSIAEWLLPESEPDARQLDEAVRDVRGRNARLCGALRVLGLLKHVDALEEVTAVLCDPPDKDAQVAAILALGELGPGAARAVDAIGSCLSNRVCRFAAIRALSQIGTEHAKERLLRSLSETWDASIAVWLAHESRMAAEAIELLVQRLLGLADTKTGAWRVDLDVILAQAGDNVVREVIRRCPPVHDRLREAALADEGRLWLVGGKVQAIRGLAVFDPHTARLAAVKALRSPGDRDRHLYPPLLYGLDTDFARELFLSSAGEEKNDAVSWAMAYALRPADAAWLQERLAATSVVTRLAAVRLAVGPVADEHVVVERLTALLDDPTDSVAQAARDALDHVRKQEQARLLVDRLRDTADQVPMRSWRLTEAALQVGGPGYKDTTRPSWQTLAFSSESFRRYPALAMLLGEQLDNMRKTALERAQQAAR